MALDVNAINTYGRMNTAANGAVSQAGITGAANTAGGQQGGQNITIAPGQVLGGEVLDVKNGEVTLRLDNNATLKDIESVLRGD